MAGFEVTSGFVGMREAAHDIVPLRNTVEHGTNNGCVDGGESVDSAAKLVSDCSAMAKHQEGSVGLRRQHGGIST